MRRSPEPAAARRCRSASAAPRSHPVERAGVTSVLSGFKAAALNVLNFTTYFEMKARAGTVGKNGVAKLIDQLAPQRAADPSDRPQLRRDASSTAAAANSTTDKIASLALLQTAFSHNGFSKSMNGFFRSVVDQKRIHGPILVTHTLNDKAVGIAYPLASRINGDKTAAFGDKNDVFGGLGRNGAQQMQDGETIAGTAVGRRRQTTRSSRASSSTSKPANSSRAIVSDRQGGGQRHPEGHDLGSPLSGPLAAGAGRGRGTEPTIRGRSLFRPL